MMVVMKTERRMF